MIVARWGNSLAVRIPADVVRELGLKEGDDVELHSLDSGAVAIVTEQQRRKALIERMRKLAMPFPKDFKFDRDEANAR